jgi:hypothetical protein
MTSQMLIQIILSRKRFWAQGTAIRLFSSVMSFMLSQKIRFPENFWAHGTAEGLVASA